MPDGENANMHELIVVSDLHLGRGKNDHTGRYYELEAFIAALAIVLAAGHEVVLLPGNHDIEIQWPPVRRQIERAVLCRVRERVASEAEVTAAGARLKFPPWFWYEPGRVWIEHGCQY